MHLKIILEIVTNLKSEKKWYLFILIFPSHKNKQTTNQTNKRPKQQPPSNIYGSVENFQFQQNLYFPHIIQF